MANFKISGVRVWGERDAKPRTVWVENDRIVDAPRPHAAFESIEFRDRNTWISAGFIDTHSHGFKYIGGSFALDPDFCGLRQGVPTIIDQGGPSCINIDAFRHFIAGQAQSNVYCFISAYLAGGVQGHTHVGLYGPDNANVALVVEAIEQNRDLVAGIKAHADHGGFSRWGSELMAKARKMSDATGLPLYVHLGTMWTNAAGKAYDPAKVLTELGKLLEPGDILAHPFTKRPSGGILANGKIHPLFKNAKKRGLRIDVGRGNHIDFNVARRLLDEGILPDTLGTDMHGFNCGPKVPSERRFNLYHAMSEMAALGIPVEHVVDMVTRNCVGFLPPSKRVSDAGGPGLTIFRMVPERSRFLDYSGNAIQGEIAFHPVGCILHGLLHRVVEKDLPSRRRELEPSLATT
jgi:dihydroorotase